MELGAERLDWEVRFGRAPIGSGTSLSGERRSRFGEGSVLRFGLAGTVGAVGPPLDRTGRAGTMGVDIVDGARQSAKMTLGRDTEELGNVVSPALRRSAEKR